MGPRFVRFRAELFGADTGSSPLLAAVRLGAIDPPHLTPAFAAPSGIFESEAGLLVADAGNHRVLAFPLPLDASSEPDLAVGQTSLDGVSPGVGASALRGPAGGAAASGVLAIADAGNHRLVIAADVTLAQERILGQATMLARAPNHAQVDAARTGRPLGV